MDRTIVRIIHVKHLFFYFLKRWRVFLVGVLLSICFFSVIGVIKLKSSQKVAGETIEKKTEIAVTETEFANILAVVEYEEMLEEKNAYIKNSVKMQIDPLHKWECWDTYHVKYIGESESSDVSKIVVTCVDLFSTQSFWEKLSVKTGGNIEVGYLRELINCYAVSGESFKVYSGAKDPEQARMLCDLVEQCILEELTQYPQLEEYCVENVKGAGIESVDNNLMELQRTVRMQSVEIQDILANRISRLTDNAKTYLELYRNVKYEETYEPGSALTQITLETKKGASLSSLKKYIYVGVVVGVLGVILFLTIVYSYNSHLLNPQNLEEMLNLRVLNDARHIPVNEGHLDVVAAKVAISNPNNNAAASVLLTGSIVESLEEEIVQAVKVKLEERGITVLTATFLKDKPNEICKLGEVEHVVLLEQLEKSEWENLTWEVSICEESGKSIVGVVLI